MALETYIVEYQTDQGSSVYIKINYDDSNASARLSAGGLTRATGGCRFIIPRKRLKPRYVITSDNGQTYFKTQDAMNTFISANKAKIIKYCGECGGCLAVSL